MGLTGFAMEMAQPNTTPAAAGATGAATANTSSGLAEGDQKEQERLMMRALLFIIGHAGFGLTDLPTQSILRTLYSNAHSKKPDGASRLNAAYGNMIIKLMIGTTTAYLYGPHATTWVEVGILHFLAVAVVVGQILLRARTARIPPEDGDALPHAKQRGGHRRGGGRSGIDGRGVRGNG